MITSDQFMEGLIYVVVFGSPLLIIYLMIRLATSKRKFLTVAIGLGLYVLYLFLFYYWGHILPIP